MVTAQLEELQVELLEVLLPLLDLDNREEGHSEVTGGEIGHWEGWAMHCYKNDFKGTTSNFHLIIKKKVDIDVNEA